MRTSRKMLVAGILMLVFMSLFTSGAIFAVSSATFVFDFVSDPGDVADGPEFDVTGVGLVDDTGLALLPDWVEATATTVLSALVICRSHRLSLMRSTI
ncbi:MAG TPA: hypothetical protein VK003_08310 [Oceanobacillus sp.]|nr:hypothetical protein [Oceanobacillus sp.]